MKLVRLSGLPALALAVLTAVPAFAQSVERTLTVDRPEVGRLAVDGTGVETWGFDGSAGEVVSVTVRSDTFEPTIQIASPGGEELARDDDGGPAWSRSLDDDARVVAHLGASGRYLVRVAARARGEGGAYEIAVQSLTVWPMELGRRVGGRYQDGRGADVWSFRGEAGEIVFVGVEADSFPGEGFFPVLQLTSPAGKPLAREDDPRGSMKAYLVAALPVDGRYYVEVHDAYLDNSGTYEVATRRLAPTPLTLNATPRAGAEVDQLVEAYSFQGVAGQTVRVELSNSGWICRLISPVGELILDACGRVVPLGVAGRYVLAVTPAPGDETIAGLPPYDPPRVRGVAVSPLEMNAPATGTLGNGRSDVWGFEGKAGQAVSVGLESPEGFWPGLFFGLRLVAPGGETLARTSLGSPQVVAQLPVDGRYFVEVEGLENEPETYRLTLRTGSGAAGRLKLDRPATGVLDGAGLGLDIWEFDGTAGQVVTVAASSDAFDPRLEILSPSSALLAVDERRDPRSPRAVLLPDSGRYRLRISADEGGSGAYGVAVRSMDVSLRRLEMNVPVAGVDEGGVDYWSFEGAGRQVVSLTVNPSDAPMALDVMSPLGEVIAWTTAERALVLLPVGGRYVVRVWGSSVEHAGAYEVVVRTVADPAAPTKLEMNASAVGTLDQDGSGLAHWAFDSAAVRAVRIAVVADGIEPVIQLMSPSGEEIASARGGFLDRRAQLEAPLPVPGRYTVRVMAVYNRVSQPRSGRHHIVVRPQGGR